MVWDKTKPAGTDAASQGDDIIRELKTDLEGAFRGQDTDGVEAKFPGSDTSAPIYRYRGLKDTTLNRPTAGEYGLYFDTTRNSLQRDNGSSWDDIGTLIPAGTVMVFYQASAPVGWTKVVTQNDKALRVVSSTGGTSGGSVAFSAGISAHTHTISADGTHAHILATYNSQPSKGLSADIGYLSGSPTGPLGTLTGGSSTYVGVTPTTDTAANHSHGGATGSGGSASAFAYIDVLLCQKD